MDRFEINRLRLVAYMFLRVRRTSYLTVNISNRIRVEQSRF